MSAQRHQHRADPRHSRELLLSSAFLTLVVFFVEFAGGFWTGSLALLSDAGHVFMDLTALFFSYMALMLSERPVSSRRTFGFHRLEVFAAFLNGLFVCVAGVWIIWEAFQRLEAPPQVKAAPMFLIALAGLGANAVVAWRLHQFSKIDINIRGAFVHVMGDALSSAAVVLGAVAVYFTGRDDLDPLVGLFVAAVLLFQSWRLVKDSVHILLEGTPSELQVPEVLKAIESIPRVSRVEDLHIWSICSHIYSLSAHLTLPMDGAADQEKVLDAIQKMLRDRFRIEHTTLQVHFLRETIDK